MLGVVDPELAGLCFGFHARAPPAHWPVKSEVRSCGSQAQGEAVSSTSRLVRCFRSLTSGSPVGVPRFSSVYHFVESLACGMPRKPASIGEGTLCISTKWIILSNVLKGQAIFSCRLALWQVLLLLPSVGPRVGKSMSSAPLLAYFQRLATAKALVLAGS